MPRFRSGSRLFLFWNWQARFAIRLVDMRVEFGGRQKADVAMQLAGIRVQEDESGDFSAGPKSLCEGAAIIGIDVSLIFFELRRPALDGLVGVSLLVQLLAGPSPVRVKVHKDYRLVGGRLLEG